MLRRTFLTVAGILTALAIVCGPPSRASAQPAQCNNGGNPTSFLNSVQFFTDANYRPGRGQNLPNPLSNQPPNAAALLQGLQDAFCAAPPDFQTVLSSLAAVWINTATCNSWDACYIASWGWWRRLPGHPIRHERLVGLSSSLWSNTYSGYETTLTQSILQQSGVTYSQVQPTDSVGIGLLAALAHEIGHIRWFEWGVNANPASFCTLGNFFRGWDPASTIFQTTGSAANGYWRELLDHDGRARVPRHPITHHYPYWHNVAPQTDAIDALQDGSPAQEQLIYQLLVSPTTSPPTPMPPWASLFASMSPDEDFIETYKFMVLTDGSAQNQLRSATITVPNAGTANIVSDYLTTNQRPDLLAKVACFPGY